MLRHFLIGCYTPIGNKDHRQILVGFVLDFIRAWSGPEIYYIRAGGDGGTAWEFPTTFWWSIQEITCAIIFIRDSEVG